MAATPASAQVTVQDIINNLQHPKVVEAFLLSPVFITKLPAGVQLFLRPHYPVLVREGIDKAKLAGEKYTWAIVHEKPGTNLATVVAGALVDESITDEAFDALDVATRAPDFQTVFDGQKVMFRFNGTKITSEHEHYRAFMFALEGGAVSDAAEIKVIISNGPRWLAAGTQEGRLTFSRTFGSRKTGEPIDAERPTTTMYGGLVGNAFENVITRDAMASLQAARAAAAVAR